MKTVHIKTLGCKVNFVESLALEEMLSERGFSVVDSEVCDIFILNSCSVTNESDRKCRQALHRNRVLNPHNYAVVMGCYAQISKEELLRDGNANLITGNMQKLEIVDALEEMSGMNVVERVGDISKYRVFESLPSHGRGGKTRGFVKIEDGCDHFCTYCIIPHARGRVRSRPLSDIAQEVEFLATQGTREIVLTGIEVASYGRDLKGPSLIDAIETAAQAAPEARIRLSSLEVGCITSEFLRRLRAIPGFCHHFHLSLQSGSNDVLHRMGRRYTTEEFLEKMKQIRGIYPNAGITTDVIAGFPEETEQEFSETCAFLERAGFLRMHVFPYSPRKNTPAARMRQVPASIKRNRAAILRSLSAKLESSFLQQMEGALETVLIEHRHSGHFQGYTSNYLRVMMPVHQAPQLEVNAVYPVRLIRKEENCDGADDRKKGGLYQWTIVSSAKL